MTDTLSPILQWINDHPEFAGLVTFAISTIESVAIIGTIIPGTVMMTAIGTLAGMGIIPLWPTLIWAILGAIVGDGISYWVGRTFNSRLPFVWPFRTHPNLLESGESFFRKYGSMSVFIGRFVGPVRALVPLVAGMLGMSPWRFTIANVLSAIGWAPVYMLPGILIGAASLELPPDIAIHAVVMLIVIFLAIMLVIWLIRSLLKLIGRQIDQMLTQLWVKLCKIPYFNLLTHSIKHHNPSKTHGQLTLAFYFLTISCVLLYLTLYIYWCGSQDILVNNMFFHFFRSLRTPLLDNIILGFTFLGEKCVLLPLMITLFGWFAYTKRWHTAWHVLALGLIASFSVEILKVIAHSPRPWGLSHGLENYSFPSGHTTLTVVFYSGIAFLLIQSLQINKSRKFFIYYPVALLILIASFSRLYLGVHWFTDIVGGWLLGSALFMLVAISYNRSPEKKLQPKGIILTILLTLLLSTSVAIYRDFGRLQRDYAQQDWPTYTITLASWWNQQGKHLPLYRVNRFGLVTNQILNVQWVGNLADIEGILLQNGWTIPAQTDLAAILHRVSDVESAEHLPLLSPLYMDKSPVLILVKHTANKKLIVLRFWNPYLTLSDAKQPLWVGSVELAPRTYSWLFKHKPSQVMLTNPLLFNQLPANYEIKELMVKLDEGFHPKTQPLILIKQR
jgi:membrane protein DedA with SNARE-associated domain/membrane-associated phospholipid phosphatase